MEDSTQSVHVDKSKVTTTAAFPLWINDVPAITELQHLHHFFAGREPCGSAPPTSTSLLSINDVFRCNTRDPQECWQYVLLSSYMTDLEWLLTSVPELSAVTQKVVMLSGDKGTATLRRAEKGRYLPTSAAHDRANPFLAALLAVSRGQSNHTGGGVASSSPVGLTRDRFVALEPPLPIAYGTHHTKMAICINARGVRVCVFTANLLERDWCWKTQGTYLQDFPWEDSHCCPPPSPPLEKSSKAADFQHQLRHYLAQCGLDATTPFSWESSKRLPLGIFNTDFLGYVNFADTKVWLVTSVPGSHVGGEARPGYRVGLCRLAEALEKSSAAASFKDASVVLTWQYSSQGSLKPNFLNLLQAAMCGAPEVVASATTKQSFLSPPANIKDVQVIYPTETEVRNSVEGWRGGSSLPVRLQCCNEFLNERLHRWGCLRRCRAPSDTPVGAVAHNSLESAIDVDKLQDEDYADGQHPQPCAAEYRQYAMPHIKSYAAMNADRTYLHWYLLTSANLSQAAWGSLSANTTKVTPRRLLVRSYELGVLYDRTSAVCPSTVPWFSVVASPCIELPTSANSKDALFATPLGDIRLSEGMGSTLAESSLFLPCDMLRPEPYASTSALRARRRSNLDGAVLAMSCRDVPWVVDIPHRGVDAYGRDVEEAFAEDTLPPLCSWRPRLGSEVGGGAGAASHKRARDSGSGPP
ncbi:tyrosyl-DNA phosphodiesterase-like protein [Leptomonas seymouri]|uniref:Tyrosyl-DNA phosphodiesterase-like protein n=1 Tax=Leptomonas seymouri TaxID=5684 RepID=A0A0N0P3C9_LEPSE|nr:tyrosyl-DNA phosphodiesterase-like protein [Leptomonas seymouri]|eukprot:KPI83979.1 tyrosyl-DNA phosphodiesterase-like protein [Leptomonas seymouri]